MIGCGIATTSALIFRVPGGHAMTCGGVAGVLDAGSVSVFGGAAGISSLAVGATGIFAAVSGTTALGSIVAFSTAAVAGVWATASEAVNKLRMIAANEMTKYLTVDLKPSISLLLLAVTLAATLND
jgi:hypothetical protein